MHCALCTLLPTLQGVSALNFQLHFHLGGAGPLPFYQLAWSVSEKVEQLMTRSTRSGYSTVAPLVSSL